MNNNILKIFYGFVGGIGISIMFFVLVLKTKWHWNREFETSDILNVILAICVSIYLPIKLGDTIEKLKSQKQIIISMIDDIKELGESLIGLIEKHMQSTDSSKSILEDISLNRISRISQKIEQILIINQAINIIDNTSIERLKQKYQDFYNTVAQDYRSTHFNFDSSYLRLYTTTLERQIISELNDLKNSIVKE